MNIRVGLTGRAQTQFFKAAPSMQGLIMCRSLSSYAYKRAFGLCRSTLLAVLGALLLAPVAAASTGMVALDDDEMSAVTGQALLMMDKQSGSGVSSDVNFYRAGLDAVMELNANIEKLQLGCGGINGPGCDIDIDYLSLTGPDDCTGGRPGCSAQLTRPFIEFAIKNDHDPALREILGFRLSAELVQGLMTAGQNDGTPNGINALSGYMSIADSSGTTQTQAGNFTETLTGRARIGGCIAGCPVTYITDDAPIPLPSLTVDFDVPAFDISGNRMQSIQLQAMANVPDIPLAGTRAANMQGCFWILFVPLCGYSINQLNITGTLSGLSTDITIEQDLGLIHRIPVNNPFSLSLQKEDIFWPGAPVEALAGWWLAFNDPVNLGSLDTPAGFEVDISSAFPEVATQVSQYLTDNPLFIPFGDAVGSLFTGSYNANVGTIDLSSFPPVSLALTDLPLGPAQDVVPNCWGNASFC